jgi:hypothetical protein
MRSLNMSKCWTPEFLKTVSSHLKVVLSWKQCSCDVISKGCIKTMWRAIFQNKLTIYKANLPSFVQKIIKSRCNYVDLFRRLRLKSHPKMAAWETLIQLSRVLLITARDCPGNLVHALRPVYTGDFCCDFMAISFFWWMWRSGWVINVPGYEIS